MDRNHAFIHTRAAGFITPNIIPPRQQRARQSRPSRSTLFRDVLQFRVRGPDSEHPYRLIRDAISNKFFRLYHVIKANINESEYSRKLFNEHVPNRVTFKRKFKCHFITRLRLLLSPLYQAYLPKYISTQHAWYQQYGFPHFQSTKSDYNSQDQFDQFYHRLQVHDRQHFKPWHIHPAWKFYGIQRYYKYLPIQLQYRLHEQSKLTNRLGLQHTRKFANARYFFNRLDLQHTNQQYTKCTYYRVDLHDTQQFYDRDNFSNANRAHD
ncbi:unnamed protein product [Clonostachys rosea]|uniref:Uncharacterized protein n=1 Tax=Bionectria ochroleuca TaxID=29856 RepID=A0ABY6V2I7_BIOOC|nr:unnamed protein product [Clonostachys rosea]